MKIPKELRTVTTLSKTIALIMFISMPIIGFFIGRNYQMALDTIKTVETSIKITPTTFPIICPMDAMLCPDGSSVGRIAPNCDFAPCPTGIVVKKNPVIPPTPSSYVCPTTGYVDCMPGPGPVKSNCSSAYLQWAKKNCPNFNGAAY